MPETPNTNGATSDEATAGNGAARKSVKRPAARPARAEGKGQGAEILFSWPKFEMGEQLRDQFTAAPARVMETFEKIGAGMTSAQSAASEAAEALRETYSVAGKGMRDFQLQLLTFVQADFNRLFEAAKAVAGAKSIPEALEIQASAMRDHAEQQLKQLRTLSELSVDAAKGSVEPLADVMKGAFKRVGR